MIQIMKTWVNGGNPFLRLSTITPKLSHVNLTGFVVPTRIPWNYFLTFGTYIGHHFRHKTGIGKLHFIRTDMQIRHIKRFTDFIHQQFQNFHPFRTLHIMAESTYKCSAMSGHIYFGNQRHVMCFTECNQLLGFFQRIIFAGHAGGIRTIVQHRKNLTFQTPGLILGQMPVKNIDFEFGKRGDFTLKFIQWNVASSNILHKSANPESRPVDDLSSLNMRFWIPFFCQLP